MAIEKTDLKTTDSFDPHIIPAETKARKEREGNSYKQTPDNAQDPNSIHTADGYTVDTEGLVNNYAVEPPMYVEQLGDLVEESLPLVETFTIVDMFLTHLDAENAVAEIEKAGISRGKISILGKDYQDTEHGHKALQWSEIKAGGGLTKVLTGMGIVQADASKYEREIEANKLLVIVIGKNEDVIKSRDILLSIGHQISDRQERI